MNKRQFLTGLGAGVFSVATTNRLLADIQCDPPIPYSAYSPYWFQNCRVGIPSNLLHFVVARQRSSQWCWAACIQMMFRLYGYDLPQELLVEQTWGRIRDMPATSGQILQALNRTYIDTRGQRFTAFGDAISVNLSTAIHDLTNRNPLIVGALGHATVLTALEYTHNNTGQLQITKATVRDPWPYRKSRRTLSQEEWFNITFAARIRCFPL